MHPSSVPAGPTADEELSDFAELMEEPAGGRNYGRRREGDRFNSLSVEDAQARELLREGGWSIVSPSSNGAGTLPTAGMTAHRGVLHPNEHVDHERLVGLVEGALGFTLDDVHAVYRQGRLSADQQELRAQIDARLLALSRSGANMDLLARLLGFKGPAGTWPFALKNAIARAKAAERSGVAQ
jgi:hypothetical protein